MALSNKPLAQITESDLLALIEDEEAEGKMLDYKRDLVGQSEGQRKEFLYDASSFANTLGGDLVFGMDETNGVPTKLVGLADIDPDKEILRLEQMLRDGVRPPITGVQTVRVQLVGGNVALVMRIPKSWNPPHQVTFQNVFRFYARSTNGKYQIDVDELRSIFSLSGTVADRIRAFRVERVAKIAGGDTPVILLDGGVLVLHVAPFSAFAVGAPFPLRQAANSPRDFPPIGNPPVSHHQINFDGLITTSNLEPPPEPQRAYTQVLRTGAVEAVASSLARGERGDVLMLDVIESYIIRHARGYAASLCRLGVEPPFAIFVSLLNVEGMRLSTSRVLQDDQLHFVETIFEAVPEDDKGCARQLQVTLDHLANAAGLPRSPYFDDSGNYTRVLSGRF